MARSNRSSINLDVNTSQRVSAPGVTSQAVPQFVSSMQGVDPFAGDMSAAFSNFFGSINKSLGDVLETNRAVEIDDLKRTREEVQLQAQIDALKSYEKNKDNLSTAESINRSIPEQVQVGDQMINTDEWKAYGKSYNKSLGRLNGNKMYANMIEEAARQQVTPEGFEAFTSKYFEDNYTDGTGDPYHDVEMQSAWRENTQQARLTNELEVVKRLQAKRMTAAAREVYSYTQTPNGMTTENYYASSAAIREANPQLTDGQVKAKTLGIWIEGAKKTKNGAQQLMSFFDRKETLDGEDLTELPSLAERFPAEIAQHKAALYDAHSKFVTLEGQEALKEMSAVVTAAVAMPTGTAAEIKAKRQTLIDTYRQAMKLDQIAGVGGNGRAKITTQLAAEMVKIKDQTILINKTNQNADGSGNHILTNEELKNTTQVMYADLNVDTSEGAFKFGQTTKNLMDRHNGYISPIAVEKLVSAFNSKNPTIIKNAVKAAEVIDPSGAILAAKFKDNPFATMYLTAAANGNLDQILAIDQESLTVAIAETTVASAVYGDEKQPTGTKAKKEIEERIEDVLFGDVDSGFLGDDLGELITGDSRFIDPDWKYSPTLEKAVREQARVIAGIHKANTGMNIGTQELRKRLAATFKGKVVPFGNLLDFQKEVGGANTDDPVNTSEVTSENASYGLSVRTPWGEDQNTVENIKEAKEDIFESLVGISENVDVSKLEMRPYAALRGKNVYGVRNIETGLPLSLSLNQNITAQGLFNSNQERMGGWRNWVPFVDGFEDETVKLTGDLQRDSQLMQRYLHPAVTLIPIREGSSKDGDVRYYDIGIKAFFKDPPADFMTEARLREAIAGKFAMPRRQDLRSKIGASRFSVQNQRNMPLGLDGEDD